MLTNLLSSDLLLIGLLFHLLEFMGDRTKMMIKLPGEKSKGVKQLQSQFSTKTVEAQQFDLLVIDDNEFWRKVITETFFDMYRCDTAATYEEAVEKIYSRNFKVICLSQPLHTVNEWRNLLIMLRAKFPETPVIMISNDPPEEVQSVQSRYPNVKEIIFKGEQSDGSDFVFAISKVLPKLLAGV